MKRDTEQERRAKQCEAPFSKNAALRTDSRKHCAKPQPCSRAMYRDSMNPPTLSRFREARVTGIANPADPDEQRQELHLISFCFGLLAAEQLIVSSAREVYDPRLKYPIR
jgi:hypothetical protein